MSQLNFDIFCLIFEELPLQELINFRLVSRQWKAWIDDCLARSSVILIGTNSKLNASNELKIAKMSLSMNLDLDVIFKNRLNVPYEYLERKDFPRCFSRMFPAVRQLYFLHYGISSLGNRFIDLFRGWNLETLALPLLCVPTVLYDPLTDYLNGLKSLRTLIIFNGYHRPPNGFTPEAPFLYRVERVYIPSVNWLPQLKPEVTANLIAFGSNSDNAQILFTGNTHLNLQALTIYMEIGTIASNTDFFSDLLKWANNIRTLEIVCFQRYQSFDGFEQINQLKNLSVLRVGVHYVRFFRSLLANAASFKHITELQIFLYSRSYGDLKEIANLGDAFPPMMRSVKLIRIRPRCKMHAEKLRLLQPAIEKLPYPVRIEQPMEEIY